MLSLSRRVGEVIRIGPDITVQVAAVNGGQVRLWISAPKDVAILREELLAVAMKAGQPILTEKGSKP